MMRTSRVSTRFIPTLVLAGTALLGSVAAEAGDEGYGYYRILEGSAERYGVTDEERSVSENEPLLEGDRVTVDRGSRLEVVLPDFSRMRLGEYSDVDFERLRAVDDRAQEYRLRLFEGEVQLTIDERPEEFLLELDVASVYLLEGGSYRISGGVDEATVVVREGYAEILTEAGSAVARTGEEVVVRGFDEPRVWVEEAGSLDALERWAEANEREAERSNRYVDDRLGYAAADLDREGEWLDVGGSYAWRPLDRPGWNRPYHSGYWYDTPYGIHWVSQYRWGWLTAHYGYWDFDRHFGWVWYPGAAYSPAWVHWYWGPSYVGWVPSGYYYRHFGHWGYNYYGYVGANWYGHHGHNTWTFCPRDRFGHRRERFYYDGVDVVPRNGRGLQAGIVTTDTRGLRRQHWNRAEEAERVLIRNASRTRGGLTYRHPEDLPDAVSYVTRRASALPTDSGGQSRLGPVEQVARTRTGVSSVNDEGDSRIAGGLVVRRGVPTSTGSGIESRPVGTTGSSARPGAGADAGDRAIVRRGSPDGSTTRRERVEADRGRSRIVLPSSPPALGRPPAADRGESDDTERRVAGRSDRVERRGDWEIERREIPQRDSVRERPSSDREANDVRGRPATRSTPSSSSARPSSSERPRAGYDRTERSRPSSSASPRSTPPRRYDRPSSRPSSSSRASSGSSSRRSSSASSSSGRSRSSSSSSSSGSSSRSRSSSSDDDR